MKELLEEFLKHISVEKNFSLHTQKAYRSDVEQFLSYLKRAGKGIEEVDHRFLRRYLAYLETVGNSRITIARKLASIRSFFRYLQLCGRLSQNPTLLISSPKLSHRLPTVLKGGAVKELLAAPDTKTFLGKRDRAILEVLYGTGVRVGELISLTVDSLDLAHLEVKVKGKGRKERVVPLNLKAADALRDYLKARKRLSPSHNFVFVNKSGGPLSAVGVRNMLFKYARKINLDKIPTPHTFRHTFATHLLEAGADLRVVQELLGHVDLSSTQIYTQLNRTKLKNIYERTHPRA